MNIGAFQNKHKFQDEVWGEIKLNSLERDIIDTPEFQRLFRTSQLGFVELVYPAANHTRGAHSIGACHAAKELINRALENTRNLRKALSNDMPKRSLAADFDISEAEAVLISAGALLHDISHVPLSHDLERKTHLIPGEKSVKVRSWYGHYDKHDDYDTNPLLYILIFDVSRSVLARVLRHYSRDFWKQLKADAKLHHELEPDPNANPDANPITDPHHHIRDFVELASKAVTDWDPEADLLPQLLFHLLFFEKSADAEELLDKHIMQSFAAGSTAMAWHLGPRVLAKNDIAAWHNAWYQPYRHDIIGNTLSADLLDYLRRDAQHLGSKRQLDLHLLNYYVVVNAAPNRTLTTSRKYRCAIDLQDHKRGTPRTFLLNDIFRLLDLRQEIHEKAVVHRVVQSANAMLARGLLLLGDKRRPPLEKIVGMGKHQYFPLQCEDILFAQLLQATAVENDRVAYRSEHLPEAASLFKKLVERRVYRPLMIIPGDWAADKLPLPRRNAVGVDEVEFSLRSLAAIVDSAFFSPFLLFVCWCVEKYLQGSFNTDAELCEYAQMFANGTAPEALMTEAKGAVPSRVIIWTTPFKQLYKDPALVVALETCVAPIDEIAKTPGMVHDTSSRVRLETAIRDADSKYSSLWRLYVFISDGLYYSGVLDKLLRKLPPECHVANRDSHETRIENAKALLSIAFESIGRTWSTIAEKEVRIAATLQTEMTGANLTGLIHRWLGAYKDGIGRIDNLSTVDTSHYCHGYAHDRDLPEEKKIPCRDICYKFDNHAKEVWKRAEDDQLSERHKLVRFLKQCRLTDPEILSEMEFELLFHLFTSNGNPDICCDLAAGSDNDPSVIPKALEALWWPARSIVQAEPTPISTWPETVPEIEIWLDEEIKVLRPNLSRRIRQEWGPLISFIESTARVQGAPVYLDLRIRLRNDSTLLWNDVREGRVLMALKRKWAGHQPSTVEHQIEED